MNSRVSSLNGAVEWVSGTLLGSTATTIAILAIAGVGFLALRGHLDVRRGITVIVGCFVLFGAPVIARALIPSVGNDVLAEVASAPPAPAYAPAIPRRMSADPNAGASVPDHRTRDIFK